MKLFRFSTPFLNVVNFSPQIDFIERKGNKVISLSGSTGKRFHPNIQPDFEVGKKMFDPINYDILLSDVKDLEFRCDGKKYITKVEGGIFNSPSPHLKEIINMTIG